MFYLWCSFVVTMVYVLFVVFVCGDDGPGTGGRILCSTIAENAVMMKALLDVEPVVRGWRTRHILPTSLPFNACPCQWRYEVVGAVLVCRPQAFKPSIPHLVYQYNMYANYPCTRLSVPNPEIPED